MIGQDVGIFGQLHAVEVVVEVFVDISIVLSSHQSEIDIRHAISCHYIRIATKSEIAETLQLTCGDFAHNTTSQLDGICTCSLKEGKGIDSEIRNILRFRHLRSKDIDFFAC